MLLRTRILLLFALATLLVAASVALPAWLVLRDGQSRSTALRAELQAAQLPEAVERATASLVAGLRRSAADEALAGALATGDESGVRQRLAALRLLIGLEGSAGRMDLVGPQGQLQAAAPAAEEPLASGVTLLLRDMASEQINISFENGPERSLLLVASIRLAQGGLLSASIAAEDVLGRIARFLRADLLMRDRNGNPLFASDPALWDRAGSVNAGDIVSFEDRLFRLEAAALTNSAGAAVAELLVLTDATAEVQARRLLLLMAGGLLVIAAGATCLALYRVIRDALDPLTELARALQAVAQGDIFASAAIGPRKDEVGAIGQALEALRSNTLTLDRLETRTRLSALRERALIEREIARLTGVLEGPARQEILGLLEGENATIGPAFARLSGHVVQQHGALADLLAERTRDLALVRQALDERIQLNRMREELDVARRLQLSSVPTTFPQRRSFRLHATMVPAKEVGGDFCDFVMLDEHRLALLIGDASGKGVGAAIFIAMARSLLRAAMGRGASPAEALAQCNDTLAADNPTLMFATAVVAVLDCRTGVMTYANAGHNAPRRRGAGQEGMLAMPDGIALGVMDGFIYEDRVLRLDPGDMLLFFTDGVTEAMGPGDALFGDDRLAAITADTSLQEPSQLLDAVARAVAGFADGAPQADDMTMLALHWHGPEPELPAAAARAEEHAT
ncbi:PP2C family protein-serine/threonine phosphatase [Plastoroseomonas hellenica]|uniref:PP2C family protein-serine/threonine phosphatase n=1 Tax=Plastoroseomonas hellenica TaxID=2687306 RepID=UPI001BACEF21|nr:PP2C family protein-serine/threonine phosphatase [Plastoroseomonas hellenica]MBR0645709.1 serine/threonine-protein phosphatase [Plastoroseomonas hellenica]